MIRLTELVPGTTAIIAQLEVAPELMVRLSAMGLRLGQAINLIRCAPLNGPMHVRLGTTDLIIRKVDATHIFVVPSILASPL